MPGTTWSRTASTVILLVLLDVLSLPANAQVRFDIPAEPLGQALRALGVQANLNVYFDPPAVKGLQAPELKVAMSADDALTKLLAGTQLRAVRVDENTVRVIAEPAEKRAQSARAPGTGAVYVPNNVHLAYASENHEVGAAATFAAADTSAGSADDEGVSEGKHGLEEVVVTAQKREERLQDVPVPVTAISGQTLVDSNQLRLQDYFSHVPGLTVTPDQINGAPIIAIRGITAGGYATPVVGIVVDDVPFGATSANGGGDIAPDIDPSDLAQVEVLRGPQGTLYGAGSMGGLIKYVTIDPSTESVSGHVQAGTSSVSDGAELGYTVRGGVNVPLSDTIAVRMSGFNLLDPGYIDNPVYHIDGVNKHEVYGGRIATVWRPSEVFSLKLSALFQDDKRFGSNYVYVGPGLGDLQQNALPGTGRLDRTIQAYSATLNAKLGAADLTAVSGYNVNSVVSSADLTPSPFYVYLAENNFGVSGAESVAHNRVNKFSQEVRLTAPIGPRVDWLVGVFYTHESVPAYTDQFAADTSTGQIAGQGFSASFPTTYEEYAAFTDFTYRITDRFDIQIGGRESHNRQTYSEIDTGLYTESIDLSPSPFVYPRQRSEDSAFTYLFTPRLKLSPDVMVYARIASGYRPGGPNEGAELSHLPNAFGADKTQNYEIGTKGDVLDHKIAFDASLFYIDWKDIQILVLDPTTEAGYYANGNRAKSQGLEMSAESKPIQGLDIAAWVAWTDAILTATLPPNINAYGFPGDRLPYSSRFSGNLSFDDDFALPAGVVGFLGGTVSYIGEREGEFAFQSHERQILPSYAQIDLRAGARINDWTLNLFVNNAADKRGMLSGGFGSIFPFAFNYIQPRTVGISLARRF